MTFDLDLNALQEMSVFDIMAIVSGAMWKAGVSEQDIVAYSEKVVTFSTAKEAVYYTVTFRESL